MTKNCFRAICTLLVALALAFSPLFSQGEEEADSEPRILDEIVARVNTEIITLTDLQEALNQLRLELEQDYDDPNEVEERFSRLKPTVLRTMIQNKVMVQKAEELGISSDIDLDVSAYLEEVRKQAGIPNLDILDQYFRQRGSSLQEYRERIREQMITRALMQQFVYQKITLLTPEIREYYEEHKEEYRVPGEVELAEILFLTEGKDPEGVRRRAEEVLQKLEGGAEFGELAQEFSEGPTASRGGNIGSFTEDSINEALGEVVFDMPVGSHSGVIETDYGLQIVKVLARDESSVKPMEEVRPQIAEALYQRKAQPEMKEFLDSLYEESYIFVAPKYAEVYDVADLGISSGSSS